MYNGVINIYKEKGYTSADVVARLRGILHQKKIGHTGTLDPEAEGVLPVCLGYATKLVEHLTDKQKEYLCTIRLGVTTDTEDMTGEILTESEVNVSEAEFSEVLKSFTGPCDQVPPMYSALKQNGKRLYELAREGITVERPARRIEIFEINLKSVSFPTAVFSVRCSKGTYIRSLCRDIGEKLGCGACMEKLLRSMSGEFTLESALRLSEAEELVKEGGIEEHILPIEHFYRDYPALHINEAGLKYLQNGNRLSTDAFEEPFPGGEFFRIYHKDRFCAVYKYDGENLKAETMYGQIEL